MKINKNQIIKAVVFAGALALLPACWDKKESSNTESLYVINVLDKNNYDDCRIAGSINVPFEDVESFAKNLDRNAEIVIYCANYMCTASASAVEKLKEMGFAHVYAYEGGTAEWYQMGLRSEGKYPVEGTCKASYLTSANEKPANVTHTVAVISADELYEKMVSHGLLAVAQAPVQEVPAQAAA